MYKFNGRIHWSCVNCIVRAACREQCYKTYLRHEICDGCRKNTFCQTDCERVQKVAMWERLSEKHGKSIISIMEEYYNKSVNL